MVLSLRWAKTRLAIGLVATYSLASVTFLAIAWQIGDWGISPVLTEQFTRPFVLFDQARYLSLVSHIARLTTLGVAIALPLLVLAATRQDNLP